MKREKELTEARKILKKMCASTIGADTTYYVVHARWQKGDYYKVEPFFLNHDMYKKSSEITKAIVKRFVQVYAKWL